MTTEQTTSPCKLSDRQLAKMFESSLNVNHFLVMDLANVKQLWSLTYKNTQTVSRHLTELVSAKLAGALFGIQYDLTYVDLDLMFLYMTFSERQIPVQVSLITKEDDRPYLRVDLRNE